MTRNAKLFFTLSVLLNVLLAGAVAGIMIDQAAGRIGDRPGFNHENLSPESREVVERIMDERRSRMQPVMEDMREARGRIFEALSAEPFQADAYMAAVEELAAKQNQILQERAKATLEMAGKLPAEDRRELARQMRARERMFARKFGPAPGGRHERYESTPSSERRTP